MEQKQRFAALAQSGHFTISELCGEYGISRKTGYKWIGRYQEFGTKGLSERSRAPKSAPGRTEAGIERLIVTERRRRPTWGPKKLGKVLEVKYGIESPPANSTIGEILKRNGLVKARRRRPGAFEVDRGTLTTAERVNQVWAVDFKGWFRLGDGSRCDPLTISDLCSRYLIQVKALPQQTVRPTRKSFSAAFRVYGLPELIRVDNGSPFASMGPGGLSRLSVWWISLGIEVEFTRPGCPQDNGSHERMHRTMKAECCRPGSKNGAAQQQRFDRWRKGFNEERPHEAIGLRMPSDIYQPSARRLDEAVKARLYEPHEETKRVNTSGFISIDGKNCLVGEAFQGTDVVIEREEKSGLMWVRYANVSLGYLENSPNARLRPPPSVGRSGLRRRQRKTKLAKVLPMFPLKPIRSSHPGIFLAGLLCLVTASAWADSPPNDDFAGRPSLRSVPVTVSGTNTEATLEPGDILSGGGGSCLRRVIMNSFLTWIVLRPIAPSFVGTILTR